MNNAIEYLCSKNLNSKNEIDEFNDKFELSVEKIKNECKLNDLIKKMYLRLIGRNFSNERVILERHMVKDNYSINGLLAAAKNLFNLTNKDDVNYLNSKDDKKNDNESSTEKKDKKDNKKDVNQIHNRYNRYQNNHFNRNRNYKRYQNRYNRGNNEIYENNYRRYNYRKSFKKGGKYQGKHDKNSQFKNYDQRNRFISGKNDSGDSEPEVNFGVNQILNVRTIEKNDWSIDSGATISITNNLNSLSNIRNVNEKYYVANGTVINVTKVGDLQKKLKSGINLNVSNVKFSSDISLSLLSLSSIPKEFSVVFQNDKVYLIKSDCIDWKNAYTFGKKNNDKLFKIVFEEEKSINSVNSLSKTMLVHSRYGHPNPKITKMLCEKHKIHFEHYTF